MRGNKQQFRRSKKLEPTITFPFPPFFLPLSFCYFHYDYSFPRRSFVYIQEIQLAGDPSGKWLPMKESWIVTDAPFPAHFTKAPAISREGFSHKLNVLKT